MYLLKERCPTSAIGNVEYDTGTALTRDNEIAFGVSYVLSCIDILRSLGYHLTTVYGYFLFATVMLLAKYFGTM